MELKDRTHISAMFYEFPMIFVLAADVELGFPKTHRRLGPEFVQSVEYEKGCQVADRPSVSVSRSRIPEAY